MTFLIRDVVEGGSYVEREGDLSLGGIFFKGRYPPAGTRVEVRFRLPGVPKELRAKGEIIRVKTVGERFDFHVRFVELGTAEEREVERFLAEAP